MAENKFGSTVRMARRRGELTQRQVAEAADITPSFLSQIEAGGQIPQAACILKIADFLGLDELRLLKIARPDDHRAWKRAFGSGKCDRRQAALDRYEQLANQVARSYAPEIYPCKKCGYPVASGYCCGSCETDEPGRGA